MDDFHAGPGDEGGGCGCMTLIIIVITSTLFFI